MPLTMLNDKSNIEVVTCAYEVTWLYEVFMKTLYREKIGVRHDLEVCMSF